MAGSYVSFSEFLPIYPFSHELHCSALIMSYFVPATTRLTVHQHIELKQTQDASYFLHRWRSPHSCRFHAVIRPPCNGRKVVGFPSAVLWLYLRKTLPNSLAKKKAVAIASNDEGALKRLGSVVPADVFRRVSHAEWDTLLFFYGVVMCVGGLSLLGCWNLHPGVMYAA